MDKNELVLVVPKFVSLTRSFSEKVNLANHVKGHDYESVDFFASYNQEVPEKEATSEKLAQVSNELYARAKADVEKAIDNYIRELKEDGGTTTYPTPEELVVLAPFIAELTAGGKAVVDSVSQKIAAIKDTLSDAQVKFLRQMVLRIKNTQ